MVSVLEGGYNHEALPLCVESFLAGMNRKPLPHPAPMTMSGLRTTIWVSDSTSYAPESWCRFT